MVITGKQIQAARSLLDLEQAELARRAHVSLITVRRIEAAQGAARVAAATVGTVRRVLEEAGIEFIPQGVQIRTDMAARRALLSDLRAISERSASRLQGQDIMTEADFYDENGLPA